VFSAFFLNGYENAAIVLAGKLSGHRDKAGIFHLAMKLLKIGVLRCIIDDCIVTDVSGGVPFDTYLLYQRSNGHTNF